jgi:hypothetical protein
MGKVRWRLALLALIVVAAVAATAAPAGAGAAAKAPLSAYCGLTPSTFDSVALLTSGVGAAAGARGDVAREPGLTSPVEVPDDARGKGGRGFAATVDTYVHVVSDGAIGDVSNTAIQQQMVVVNRGFSGAEGGYDTGFRFKLAGVDRTDNAAWHYAGPGTSEERAMKKALHRGDAGDLNIYFTTAGAYLGWAYFPSDYREHPWRDGIVVDWESMPGTSALYAGKYDLGKTVTHEAGHWVGMHHVFNGGCNNWGDYVEDTPPQVIATRGCPEGQDSCREAGLDSIHNYMDYSFDSCYFEFTAGQAARAQDQWLYYRAGGGVTTPGAE